MCPQSKRDVRVRPQQQTTPLRHPHMPRCVCVCVCVCVCARKLSDGLFLRCCEEVAKDYPSIKFEAMDMDRVVLQVPAIAVLPFPWRH